MPSQGKSDDKPRQIIRLQVPLLHDSCVSDEIETLLDGNSEQCFTGKDINEELLKLRFKCVGASFRIIGKVRNAKHFALRRAYKSSIETRLYTKKAKIINGIMFLMIDF